MQGEFLIVFKNTHEVITAEQELLGAGIAVRVMAVPPAIRAGCGMCLRVSPDVFEQVIKIFRGKDVEVYNLQGKEYSNVPLPK